jgi:hypothetical protein
VEFLTLAATALDDTEGSSGGALGSSKYSEAMAALRKGSAISFPVEKRGAMLGTYFGPCRALGLVRSAESGSGVPFLLSPRGQGVWNARRAGIEGELVSLLFSDAERLDPEQVRSAIAHFSLKRLAQSGAEAAELRVALLSAWQPVGASAGSISAAYSRFSDTLTWLRQEGALHPLRAEALLAANYRRVVESGDREAEGVLTAWAEYEWRCRLHFALELMLSAVFETLNELGAATLDEVVQEWASAPDLPPILKDAWPEAEQAWSRSGSAASASVPRMLFLAGGSIETFKSASAHARGLAAFAIATALGAQSSKLRQSHRFVGRESAGERALRQIEEAADEPFDHTLRNLAEVAAKAHLETTFRKMASGQKCSLRFFPDGARLRSTGKPTAAGRSGNRLGNVIRILADAGVDGIPVPA